MIIMIIKHSALSTYMVWVCAQQDIWRKDMEYIWSIIKLTVNRGFTRNKIEFKTIESIDIDPIQIKCLCMIWCERRLNILHNSDYRFICFTFLFSTRRYTRVWFAKKKTLYQSLTLVVAIIWTFFFLFSLFDMHYEYSNVT